MNTLIVGLGFASSLVVVYGAATSVPYSHVEKYEDFPFNSVGYVEAYDAINDRTQRCSGALIGAEHVLTSAHCVFNTTSNLFFDEFGFGLKGKADDELLSTVVSEVYMDPEYSTERQSKNDMAILKLRQPLVRKHFLLVQTSELAKIYEQPGLHNSQHLETMTGFPGDKGEKMWTQTLLITDIFVSNPGEVLMRSHCQSYSGSSGSPIYDNTNNIIAVHSGAVGTENKCFSTAMTKKRIQWIQDIKSGKIDPENLKKGK